MKGMFYSRREAFWASALLMSLVNSVCTFRNVCTCL
jgi:hypothetical protein